MFSADQINLLPPKLIVTPASAGEDKELLVVAARLAREFGAPSRVIYWADLICTAAFAYMALATLLVVPFGIASIGAYCVAVLAFYRGLSFIHELTHLRIDSVPGFAQAWNVVFGIPLLVPSFMYDEVHTIHHSKRAYGTSRDPEYFPFASLPRRASVTFLAAGLLIPFGLLIRFAILAPLSAVIPEFRNLSVERYSALAINPSFRRRAPSKSAQNTWLVLESAASAWALAIVLLTVSGTVAQSVFGACIAIAVGVTIINQVRTLASHSWSNIEDKPMTLTAQYLDSVNVPPPSMLPALWAPVGLRYHGLHHLLPSVPYHSLSKAHKELALWTETRVKYHVADFPGLKAVLTRILSEQ